MIPFERPRRLRRNESWRDAVRETVLRPSDLVLPLFAVPGEGVRQPVGSMPGVHRSSPDEIVAEVGRARAAGVRTVLLFGVPDHKHDDGRGAWDAQGPVPAAIRALRDAHPDVLIWADVCLCEYTSHGHCGLLTARGEVDNDASLPLLSRTAVAYAEAGAHAVAPSDMMDGRVGAIREALDERGHTETAIVSYAVKYASAFYGPFRDAADSAPAHGDRRGYQMDPANAREALREARLDLEEGADVIMVKPAGHYLDVLSAVARESDRPMAAYQVSGEYAALKAAGERGWIDADRAIDESLLCIRRAGADLIVTYAAIEVAERLKRLHSTPFR